MAVSLTACGSSDETSDGIVTIHDLDATDVENADNIELSELDYEIIGTWSAERDENNGHFELTIDGGEVCVYYMSQHEALVFFVGTYSSLGEKFTVNRADAYEMLYEQDSLTFTYEDGTLAFEYINEDGKLVDIELEKLGDSVMMSVELVMIPDEDEGDWIDDVDLTEDIEEVEETPEIVSEEPEVTTCSHVWDNGVVTLAATCTDKGIMTYTCSKCGATETNVIPALGHHYEGYVTTQPTCGTTGTRTYQCTYCGDTYSVMLEATGNHNFQDVVETVYIDEEGHYETNSTDYTIYICNSCNTEFDSESAVQAHIAEVHGDSATYTSQTKSEETEEYIIDTPGHYEEVATGQQCTICGATQ